MAGIRRWISFTGPSPATFHSVGTSSTTFPMASLWVSPGCDHACKALQIEGRINTNGQGRYSTQHSHAGSAWPGTHYNPVSISAVCRSGSFEFVGPCAGILVISVEEGGLLRSEIAVEPKLREMVVSLSCITQWVYPNKALEQRVSVAFNARSAPRPRRSPLQRQPTIHGNRLPRHHRRPGE